MMLLYNLIQGVWWNVFKQNIYQGLFSKENNIDNKQNQEFEYKAIYTFNN